METLNLMADVTAGSPCDTRAPFAIGALFVIINAISRFNTPPNSRSCTTAERYFTSMMIYVSFMAVVYVVFCQVPHVADGLLDLEGKARLFFTQATFPLYVALVLTVFLPQMPVLSHLDEAMRRKLQRFAAIPFEALRLSRSLQNSKWAIPTQRRAEFRTQLESRGMPVEHVRFELSGDAADALKHLWTKVGCLMCALDRWTADPDFSAYMAEFPNGDDKLNVRFSRIRKRGIRVFECLENARDVEDEGNFSEVMKEMMAALRDDCEDLLAEICDRIARGVLRHRLTAEARGAELEAMGFTRPPVSPEGININQVVGLFVFLTCMFLVGSVILPFRDSTMGEWMWKGPLIATIYCTAVVCAVWPKLKWSAAQKRPGGVRPFGAYLLSGLVAVVLATGIAFGFDCVRSGWQLDLAWETLRQRLPFQLLTFTTAFTTAALIDDDQKILRGLRLRIGEAGLFAVALGLTSVFAWQIMKEQCDKAKALGSTATEEQMTVSQLPPPEVEIPMAPNDEQTVASAAAPDPFEPPPLWAFILLTTTIGGVLGWCVPTWYRASPDEGLADGTDPLGEPEEEPPPLALA